MTSNIQFIRLAIVSSHPIQYNAPLFKLLSQRKDHTVKVFYSWKGTEDQNDPEFDEKITWDIPLLTGYEYSFIDNRAKDPGTHHFYGLDNPSMVAEIEHWGANAVLVYGWAFKTHLSVLRHFHGRVPVFFRGDSTLLTGGNLIRRLFRKIWLNWVYSHIDVAFYPGKHSKNYFLAYGLPLDKLCHVPHSVDNNRFSKNALTLEAKALQKRKQLGIPDDSLVLLFAGKLVSHKQPILLLQVAQELVQLEKYNIHLIFVGSGPLKKRMLALSKGSDYIHFLGFRNQTDMPLLYRLGDIYVLPSVSETWGLGVNEAMACSRAVLVSDKVGCAPDIVKPKVSGEIFSAGNKDNLTNIIREYYDNRMALIDMRRKAYVLIQQWSVEKAVKLLGDHILDQSRRP